MKFALRQLLLLAAGFFPPAAFAANGCRIYSVNGANCYGVLRCPDGYVTDAGTTACQFDPAHCDELNFEVTGAATGPIGVICSYGNVYPCNPPGPDCMSGTISISCCPVTSGTSTASLTQTYTATMAATNPNTQSQTQTVTQNTTQTQTQTQSQTQTQTQTQTASTLTDLGTSDVTTTATAVSTNTQAQSQTKTESQPQTTTQSEESTATHTEGTNQEQHQNEDVNMLHGAAAQALTNAGVDCANAANTLLVNEDAGTEALGHCVAGVQSGQKLKELLAATAKRSHQDNVPTVNAEDSLLQTGRSPGVLAEFEKNYGISGEDFVREMVASGSSLDVIEAALRKKFPEDKVDALMEKARQLAAEKGGKENMVDFGKSRPAKVVGGSLKEKLAKSLAAGDEKTDSSARATKAPPKPVAKAALETAESLTPLDDPLFSPKENPELTLFDVVHRKYQEKTRALHR